MLGLRNSHGPRATLPDVSQIIIPATKPKPTMNTIIFGAKEEIKAPVTKRTPPIVDITRHPKSVTRPPDKNPRKKIISISLNLYSFQIE